MAYRRDKKNRVLWKGEYQRPDGRYVYKYTDSDGSIRYVYSWTLTQTDRAPKGKEPGECLREMEQKISSALNDGLISHLSHNSTINQLYNDYISTANIKETTRINYKYLYEKHVRKSIGNYSISELQYTDLKKAYLKALRNGTKRTTIVSVNRVMSAVLSFAMRNKLTKINIADGIISDLPNSDEKKPSYRRALTRDEQNAFLRYTKNDSKYYLWYPLFVFLLGTGCRIGEAAALTWSQCDFENRIITIDRSLSYVKGRYSNGCNYLLSSPKSLAGYRDIPMLPAVVDALETIKFRQELNKVSSPTIDGVSGFVFLNSQNHFISKQAVDYKLKYAVEHYNDYMAQFAEEPSVVLPKFSAHILRHTFCTRMCEEGMDVKTLQTIMGHSSFAITMDIYNDVNNVEKHKAIEKLPVDFLAY